MRVSYYKGGSETAAFAASELKTYLERMLKDPLPDGWEIQLKIRREKSGGRQKDSFQVQIFPTGGEITGINDRSLLLGVYDYLHHLGCRFTAPLRELEYVPAIDSQAMCADYRKEAALYHRGVCIEGADSFENIRNFIEWLPKLGYNCFFLQFKTPWTFMARWYHHERNPFREAETFTEEESKRYTEMLEAEIKKRGLMLHKVGHGWTGEVLGYETDSWYPAKEPLTWQTKSWSAMRNGVRGLYRGIPADTNLCYHLTEAREEFISRVVRYAQENPQVDYLHIWLADEYNNVCECPECQKTTLSDQYVELLNEIDRRLTEQGLATHLVFLLYQELLWPPIRERIINQDRFVLMFAPISRTFENAYSLEGIPNRLPEYERNRVKLPAGLGENLAFLKCWQQQFSGDGFVYDYPLGRAHYGDPGYLHISSVIFQDIRKLHELGLNGYISCQELRVFLPNALPNYVMGYALFSGDLGFKEIVEEYFRAAYGEAWQEVRDYLTELSELENCDYLNGKGPRQDPAMAARMYALIKRCGEYLPENGNGEEGFWKLLEYHRGYVERLARMQYCLAGGDEEAAETAWKDMEHYLCEGELEFQPFVDAYRVLEVTGNYTLPQPG